MIRESWPPPSKSAFVFQPNDTLVVCSPNNTDLVCDLGDPFRGNHQVLNCNCSPYGTCSPVACTTVFLLKLYRVFCLSSCISDKSFHSISVVRDQLGHQRDMVSAAAVHVGHPETHLSLVMFAGQVLSPVFFCVAFRHSEQSDLTPVNVSMSVRYTVQTSLIL